MDPIAQVATEIVIFLEILYVVISYVKFVGEETVASTFIQMKRSRKQVGNHLLNGNTNRSISITWIWSLRVIGMCNKEDQP
jgi:hypothetical protein